MIVKKLLKTKEAEEKENASLILLAETLAQKQTEAEQKSNERSEKKMELAREKASKADEKREIRKAKLIEKQRNSRHSQSLTATPSNDHRHLNSSFISLALPSPPLSPSLPSPASPALPQNSHCITAIIN